MLGCGASIFVPITLGLVVSNQTRCKYLNSPMSPSLMAALTEEVEKAAVYFGVARDSCLRGVTDRMRNVILMGVGETSARM